MPDRPTEPFRSEHRALLEHLEHMRDSARQVPELSSDERAELVGRIMVFLEGDLVPHAEAEELVLYPEVARLMGQPDALASMVADHRAIRERIAALSTTDPADVASLQELLYGLYALLLVHFHKEEDVYLPVLDARPEAEVRALLDRMGEHTHTAHAH